jgi:hypothetical protein
VNLGEIRTSVQRTFGDESGVQITNEDVVRWVNDAQLNIVLENESLLQATAFANSVIGQQTYSLPVDLLILRGISFKGTSDVSYNRLLGLDRQKFDEYIDGWDGTTYNAGTPQAYFVWDGSIEVFPVPSEAVTNGFKIWYNQKPTPVVNDVDVPSIPEIYHNAISDMCLQSAYEMDEDWDAVGNKAQQVNASIKLLRGREDWTSQDTYPVISVRAEDQ